VAEDIAKRYLEGCLWSRPWTDRKARDGRPQRPPGLFHPVFPI